MKQNGPDRVDVISYILMLGLVLFAAIGVGFTIDYLIGVIG